MFDFRYHALTLVAVFLALMVGLLLGVAIGDRGLVSGAEHDLRDSLRADVLRSRVQSAGLRSQLLEQRRIQQAVYPLLVEGRLSGQRVGLIGLGSRPVHPGPIRSRCGASATRWGRRSCTAAACPHRSSARCWSPPAESSRA